MWADQRPLQGNVSYISLQPGQYLDIALEQGQYLDIAQEHLFFDCGIKFYILTITLIVTILIVADIYEQESTSGEFLNTHLKKAYFSIACNF